METRQNKLMYTLDWLHWTWSLTLVINMHILIFRRNHDQGQPPFPRQWPLTPPEPLFEWQWSGLGDTLNDNGVVWATQGDDFSCIDSWGSFLGQLCTTSNWKITLGGLSFFVRINFAKTTDDHVVYFKDYDCFAKTQFKPWIWSLLHFSLSNKIKFTKYRF
jgi:hypothetical protein